jgi:hypothetical protein
MTDRNEYPAQDLQSALLLYVQQVHNYELLLAGEELNDALDTLTGGVA